MKIDIVSDIVCPWCIIGYRQLTKALDSCGLTVDIHWHPFELNRDMQPEGEHLRDHMMRKYGSTVEQSEQNRAHIVSVGASLGIEMNYNEQSRIYNTFDAHQLMHWAYTLNRKHDLKLALMQAYFTEQLDISARQVLIDTAASIELPVEEATAVLEDQRYAAAVREDESLWTSRGISGVPAVIINDKYLLSGAQGADNFAAAIKQIQSEQAI